MFTQSLEAACKILQKKEKKGGCRRECQQNNRACKQRGHEELTAAQGLDREESVVGLYRSAGNTGILVCRCVYTHSLVEPRL